LVALALDLSIGVADEGSNPLHSSPSPSPFALGVSCDVPVFSSMKQVEFGFPYVLLGGGLKPRISSN